MDKYWQIVDIDTKSVIKSIIYGIFCDLSDGITKQTAEAVRLLAEAVEILEQNSTTIETYTRVISPAKELIQSHNKSLTTEGTEPTEKDEEDVINPGHYRRHPSGVECIVITEHMSFCLGNAVKYIWRAGLKDGNSSGQDLEKAIWYINREIERLKSKEETPEDRENRTDRTDRTYDN